jgi:HSP20 family protein
MNENSLEKEKDDHPNELSADNNFSFFKKKSKKIQTTNSSMLEKKIWPEQEGQLAVDVYQTEDEIVIQTAIAGVKAEDLDITAKEDTIIIRGKREKIKEEKETNYFYQECYWGPFSREIILPLPADTSRAQASMVEGILTIRIPKILKEGIKKIIVK